MPAFIDAKIPGNDRLVVDNPAGGKAFGHEPFVELCRDRLFVLDRFDTDQSGCDPNARGGLQPVLWEHCEGRRIKGSLGHTIGEDRIGHELRMAFPFQLMAPNLSEVMGGTGLRVWCAEPVQKRDQMLTIRFAISRGGIHFRLDCQISGTTWSVQHRKRTCVQLVGQGIAERVVFDLGHAGAKAYGVCANIGYFPKE